VVVLMISLAKGVARTLDSRSVRVLVVRMARRMRCAMLRGGRFEGEC